VISSDSPAARLALDELQAFCAEVRRLEAARGRTSDPSFAFVRQVGQRSALSRRRLFSLSLGEDVVRRVLRNG
jgi:hypothetical protein